jgi:hypothetical protein
MRHRILFLLLTGALLISCQQKKKQLSFYGDNEIAEDTTEITEPQDETQIAYDADSEVAVPFEEEGGIKLYSNPHF